MNKRMRELQAMMAQKAKEAEAAAAAGEIEKANTLLDEHADLEKEFNTLERVEKAVRMVSVPSSERA